MRLFIAINIAEECKEHLFQLRDSLDIDGIVHKVKDTHITLKFLGEVDDIKEIVNSLRTVECKPFTISLDVFGFFPDEKNIKVWWVGVKPENKIIELQQKIDDVLIGMFPKEKQFKAHLTLARVKFLENKDEFLKQLKKINIEKKEIFVDRFALMKSTLTKQGASYETLAKFRGS